MQKVFHRSDGFLPHLFKVHQFPSSASRKTSLRFFVSLKKKTQTKANKQQTKTQHNKHKHVSTKLVQVMPHQGKIPTRRCPAAFQPSVPEKCRFVNEKGRTRTQTTNEFGSPGVNSNTALTVVNALTNISWHGSAMF